MPADMKKDYNKKIDDIYKNSQPKNLNEKYSSVGSRVRSIRKKTDQILRKGAASDPTVADDNTFEGVTGKLTINKNPLQHSI